MAFTQPRYIGRDLVITCDGTKTIWSTFNITERDNTEAAVAADSTGDEVVRTTEILEGTLTGQFSSANNQDTLPAKGAIIDDLNVAAGSDSFLPADLTTRFTNIRVISIQRAFQLGPATFELQFRSHVLN